MAYIAANGITVDFPIYASANRSLKNVVLRASTGGRIAPGGGRLATIRSLDSLSFTFRPGDRIGLVGHNGSGKTTLLRVLTGVYQPTMGVLRVHGKATSLLDVTLGMDPDATGYENIVMRGVMMGLHPTEIESRVPEISEFTDLGEFLSMPLRTYSTGMQMRLAFAVSTCVDADILLLDEWLSVGDAEFQRKAAERLEGLVQRAKILVLASHSPELIHRVCNRVIELEHGRIVADRSLT